MNFKSVSGGEIQSQNVMDNYCRIYYRKMITENITLSYSLKFDYDHPCSYSRTKAEQIRRNFYKPGCAKPILVNENGMWYNFELLAP